MRKKSHFEDREPFIEKILSSLRFKKAEKHIEFDSVVLDLGCGYNGNLLTRLEPKIKSGVGIDMSVNPNFENQKIRLIAHDLNINLPFQNDEFDFIVSLANVEHLENPDQIFKEMHRVLKHGGTLLLTTPSKLAKPLLETFAFLGIISKEEISDHKNYFNRKDLIVLCKKFRFTNVSHKYFQLGMNNFLIAVK